MFRKFRQPKILLKSPLAALLVIALSGVFYLFCCQAAAAESAHHLSTSTNSAQHCHFSRNKSPETLPAARIEAFECCPLKFNLFVAKLEKNQFPHAAPVRASNFFSLPESIKLARRARPTGFSYRAPAFVSRDLHIKNCVFRI